MLIQVFFSGRSERPLMEPRLLRGVESVDSNFCMGSAADHRRSASVSSECMSSPDLARRGTFRLLPAEERLVALARDYAQMRAMFIAAPPEFEVVLARLAEAERALNASGAS